MDTHLNVAPMIRLLSIVSIVFVSGLFTGCASEEPLTTDNHTPVAGEATPSPESGPRGGWAW